MSKLKIKPCPFCGSGNVEYIDCSGGEFISCNDCTSSGPDGSGKTECIDKWNKRVDTEELLDQLQDIECLGELSKLLREYGR